MKKLFLSLFFVASVLVSCASPYDPAPQLLPAYIKNVYVRPVVNNTNQYGLEDKFTNAIIDEFMRDGRLSVVTNEDESDGVVVCEIKRYTLQPLTYDSNMVTEQYKLWILINVYFIDKHENITLWVEPNMEGIQIYADQVKVGFGGMTEDTAREYIWEKLSRDIVKRTVKGFGNAGGISEKKIQD
ncbi:MAG: LptE family protein [Elusimicrobia bacterium]|nr:LptE family protein [Elusimicrobiota bacterium]